MKTPWEAYPDLEPRSIGWRMGYGEDYMTEFGRWFGSLTVDARRRFANANPEPPGWEGFFVRRGAGPDT